MRKSLWIILLLAVSLFSCSKLPENNDIPQPGGDEEIVEKTREEVFADLPGWKFRCKVYAEKQTVESYGGEEEFMRKVDELLAGASKYFCTKGINDEGGNQMHFFMTDFAVFEGASSKYTQDREAVNETDYDLRIVINEHALDSDAASGWYRSPHLSVGLTHEEGVFSAKAKKLLAKYLAISRGAYDIAQEQVLDGSENWINGAVYESPACMTNNSDAVAHISDFSKASINVSGNERIAQAYYELLPKGMKATVKKADGSTAKGATLKFYPVHAGSGKVTRTARFSGGLSVTGSYIFKDNPFFAMGQNYPTKNIANYLVEVYVDGYRYYTWMPMHEVIRQYVASGATDSFVYQIQLPDLENTIPEGDYINRAKTFAQLPGWKFRCKIFGESSIVKRAGGRVGFMKKVDALLEEISGYYQIPEINPEGDNQVHFFMTEMVVFEGASTTVMYDTSGGTDDTYDVRIVMKVNDETFDRDGYLGSPYMSIIHTKDNYEGLWTGTGRDALVHELGHFRGAVDMYASELPASGNPITGEGYEAETCMMNSPYGINEWCEYSLLAINASGGGKFAIPNNDTVPDGLKMTVVDKDGNAAGGAAVKFYPVYPYSSEVLTEPRHQGTLSAQGVFEISSEAFYKPGTTDHIANYLVEVEYDGVKSYKWMPLYKAMEYKMSHDYTEVYLYTFQLD